MALEKEALHDRKLVKKSSRKAQTNLVRNLESKGVEWTSPPRRTRLGDGDVDAWLDELSQPEHSVYTEHTKPAIAPPLSPPPSPPPPPPSSSPSSSSSCSFSAAGEKFKRKKQTKKTNKNRKKKVNAAFAGLQREDEY
eukprot:g56654.t1